MAFIEADLTRLPKRVREKIRENCAAEDRRAYQTALKAQKKAARIYRQQPPKARAGFGECTFALHPYFAKQFERKHGYRPQDDPEAVKYFQKHHEETRVKSVSARTSIGYVGVEHWPFPERKRT